MKPFLSLAAFVALSVPLHAQSFATENPVLQRMWQEGMENSQAWQLAQALMDSVGPRLTGSPGQKRANDWAVATYTRWGIEAKNEQYGTWRGWERGITHIDLIEPRVRTLEGTMLAWSPGTSGKVRGEVVSLPRFENQAAYQRWLSSVRGKWVAISFPEPSCRPDSNLERWATPESLERFRAERTEARRAWGSGVEMRSLPRALEAAGALGVLQSRWSLGWGVNKVFSASTERVPTLDLSCEDNGLLHRLAMSGQRPVIEVEAGARFLGEVPAFNTIATIRGRELPNEYVMLSAHFDSWDASSGATDNGTGTITMMEAMRILQATYPTPRRTILVGHWSGEEQGLNGSRAFAADNPAIVEGLQALFNQDNGTGRVSNISMQGLSRAGEFFARWLAQLPSDITQHINLNIPGSPGGGGSDYASFICAGAPAFSLSSLSWDYGTYTWHTNRDTFDKIWMDDLKNNATLTAMLVYLAAEDTRVPRDRRAVMPTSRRTGQQMSWPTCRDGARTSERRDR